MSVSLKDLISQSGIATADGMSLTYQGMSPVLEFTNSGKRGGGAKHFTISLHSLLKSLEDIRTNLTHFAPSATYNEDAWRKLFSTYLTDPSTNAVSTVQTLPLFSVLAKIIHMAQGKPWTSFNARQMELNENALDQAVALIESHIPEEQTPSPIAAVAAGKGENVIYYGAPGTGKSHAINKLVHPEQVVRTVFHADTLNSDFIGCLKPSVAQDGNQKTIGYSFMPGPFARALVMALKEPNKHFWLVIEEINRAPAASVFGETFQLLDRKEDGKSEYDVAFADPSFQTYVNEETGLELTSYGIPANLTLLASMNSSDQGVMPMDTAFKRRWSFRYIPIDFQSAPTGSVSFTDTQGNKRLVTWTDFALSINSILSEKEIPEDRHFGPFFLNTKDLTDSMAALTGKLFVYLWDDVLRHGYRKAVFDAGIRTYGQLVAKATTGERIYSDAVLTLLSGKALSTEAEPAE